MPINQSHKSVDLNRAPSIEQDVIPQREGAISFFMRKAKSLSVDTPSEPVVNSTNNDKVASSEIKPKKLIPLKQPETTSKASASSMKLSQDE